MKTHEALELAWADLNQVEIAAGLEPTPLKEPYRQKELGEIELEKNGLIGWHWSVSTTAPGRRIGMCYSGYSFTKCGALVTTRRLQRKVLREPKIIRLAPPTR